MDWVLSALLISAGLSMVLSLLLWRFVRRWSPERAAIIAAVVVPVIPWLLIFALEVGAGIHHAIFEPDAPFMVGVFAMAFPVMLFSMFVNFCACALLFVIVRPTPGP